MTVSSLVKSPGGNYQARNDSPALKVGDRASQMSPSTAISETFPPELAILNSLPADFLVSGQVTPDCELDSTTQNQACGLKPCAALQMGNQALSSSKILRDLSVEDFEQFLEDCEWSDIVGMIHKSYRLRNSKRRTSAKGFSSLPTPTTYAKGSGKYRPAGATRLEQSLRKFIREGDKLHPAAPGWMMGFPPGWVEEILMGGGVSIRPPITQECVSILPSAENVTTSTPAQSRPSKLPLPSRESCISKVSCPSCEQPLLKKADSCGVCGWVQSPQKVLEDGVSDSLEKTSKKAPSEITSHIQVATSPSGSLYRYLKNIKLKSGQIASYPRVEGERDSDNLKHWYWGYNYKVLEDGLWKSKSKSVPKQKVSMVRRMIENNAPVAAIKDFIKVLEDSEPVSREKVLEESLPHSLEKNQASGCLYRYLKNKKLKSGAVASYPRVDGTRNPDNPDHWYWGYSYEVLEDGQWKGRSLSVPKHKVVTVQAMIDSHKSVNAIKAFIEGERTTK